MFKIVWIKSKFSNLPDSHTILHRVISIMFISIDRVFNWLLDYI